MAKTVKKGDDAQWVVVEIDIDEWDGVENILAVRGLFDTEKAARAHVRKSDHRSSHAWEVWQVSK